MAGASLGLSFLAPCNTASNICLSFNGYHLRAQCLRLLSTTHTAWPSNALSLRKNSVSWLTTSRRRYGQSIDAVESRVGKVQEKSPGSHASVLVTDEDAQSALRSVPGTDADSLKRKPGSNYDVRKLLRQVPYPIAIITSTDPSQPEVTHAWRGATVSSFNTVAILPSTIVSVNLKTPSSTFDAIRHSEEFLVHLLNANNEAAELARSFTKGNRGNLVSPFIDLAGKFLITPTISVNEPRKEDTGPPKINDSEDPAPGPIAFVWHCRYLPKKTVEIGDHVMLFGIVDRTYVTGKQLSQIKSKETKPRCLVYVDGQYCRAIALEEYTQASEEGDSEGTLGATTTSPSTPSTFSATQTLEPQAPAKEEESGGVPGATLPSQSPYPAVDALQTFEPQQRGTPSQAANRTDENTSKKSESFLRFMIDKLQKIFRWMFKPGVSNKSLVSTPEHPPPPSLIPTDKMGNPVPYGVSLEAALKGALPASRTRTGRTDEKNPSKRSLELVLKGPPPPSGPRIRIRKHPTYFFRRRTSLNHRLLPQEAPELVDYRHKRKQMRRERYIEALEDRVPPLNRARYTLKDQLPARASRLSFFKRVSPVKVKTFFSAPVSKPGEKPLYRTSPKYQRQHQKEKLEHRVGHLLDDVLTQVTQDLKQKRHL